MENILMHAPFNYTLRLFHVNLSPWWICEINEFIQINRSTAANNTLLILTSDAHLVTVMQMTIMHLSLSKAVWGMTIIIASIYIYIYIYTDTYMGDNLCKYGSLSGMPSGRQSIVINWRERFLYLTPNEAVIEIRVTARQKMTNTF